MIVIKRVTELVELEEIKRLLRENHINNISKEVATNDGFLSADYSIDFLKTMHDACPSIIAKDGDRVVGYALVAIKEVRNHHDLLAELFNTIDTQSYKNISLKDEKYVVVGQLCVDKDYRGQGLTKRLYNHFRECLSNDYHYCVTDVAVANNRSLAAHVSTGFVVINSITYGGIAWNIVLWDWTKQ